MYLLLLNDVIYIYFSFGEASLCVSKKYGLLN